MSAGLFLFVLVIFSAETFSAPPTNLYWGDLHVHSNRSPDSFAFGNSRLTPDNAYRFAKDGAPRFLISAYKDADGANLDRMQVIKGYLTEDGELKERVYEVAFAGKREIDDLGKLPPIGSTVDVADASYTNSIGATSLDTLWEDLDFNPKERVFYYVRVLEIPTPRWSAYDVKKFDLIDVNEDIPMVTQERVYSSPIWYSPSDL